MRDGGILEQLLEILICFQGHYFLMTSAEFHSGMTTTSAPTQFASVRSQQRRIIGVEANIHFRTNSLKVTNA